MIPPVRPELADLASRLVAEIRHNLAEHRTCAVAVYDVELHDAVMGQLSDSERSRVDVKWIEKPDFLGGEACEAPRQPTPEPRSCKHCGGTTRANTEYGPLCYDCGGAWEPIASGPYRTTETA